MQKTEMRNTNTINIDKASAFEMVKSMNSENFNAVNAVENVLEDIAKAVDRIAESFEIGGRLLYIGAGTSGRLGVLDASECPPTFGVDKNTVVGIIAGGVDALTNASEGAEDNEQQGVIDVKKHDISRKDVLVGVSAAGNAAYVAGAINEAKKVGAYTISLTCNGGCLLSEIADLAIVTDTGAEVITGSTRLKAGTAQKLVLNMLSTCAMIKTGKVYENFMINVRPLNIKLKKRCIWIITQITGADEAVAETALDKANGSIKEAIELIRKA